MGCSRATRAPVTHGERFTSAKRPSRPAMKKTAPKMLTREIVFALRWKICDIGREVDQRCGKRLRCAANTRPRGNCGRAAERLTRTSLPFSPCSEQSEGRKGRKG